MIQSREEQQYQQYYNHYHQPQATYDPSQTYHPSSTTTQTQSYYPPYYPQQQYTYYSHHDYANPYPQYQYHQGPASIQPPGVDATQEKAYYQQPPVDNHYHYSDSCSSVSNPVAPVSQPVQYRGNISSVQLDVNHQMTTSSPAGGCNSGPVKPRVRARRGQATDPHSIAEWLRREKITERMKNLQELIPNSNKTDKASMLDEIIEYVNNLQLQVKVLSMSRLGAAGAVVPLITNGHAQVVSSDLSSLSPSATEVAEFPPSADQIALEQEVVKLMESNVSTAMQFLQTKGLCPMPLPLANAISAAKTSSSSSNQSLFTSGLHNHNSSSSSSISNISVVRPDQISSDSNMLTGKLNQGFVADGCDHTLGCTARTRM